MHETIRELLAGGPVVTDGGWGTELQARGLPVGACPEAWNLEHPDRVEDVARAYVEAGSQVILTNTFGGNPFVLARHQLHDRVEEINRRGAEISRRAAGDRAVVFGSIGPSGVMLMMGDVSAEQLQAGFAAQAAALAEGGAHGLVVETMSDPAEAKLAVAAAKTTGLPVVGCMVFDTGPNKDRTMMGTTPEDAAIELIEAGADVLGSNCGQGVEGFAEICRRMRAVTELPLWIKANAGLPEMVDGKTVYAQSPEEFASQAGRLVPLGASFLGGCCGTNPDFIRAVKADLARLGSSGEAS